MRRSKVLCILLCLMMLTGCVAVSDPGAQETKPTEAELRITSLEFTAQYIRTDGYHEDAAYPQVTVLPGVTALEQYYEANKGKYDLEAKAQTGVGTENDLGFGNVIPRYDETFFQKSYVIAILLEEPSGSIHHKVTAASQYEDGRVGIAVERIVPEAGTEDMAQWHILVEVSREAAVKEAGEVCVHLDGEFVWDGGVVEPIVYILGGEDHTHQAAETAQTVADPITGYCGNTWTKLYIGNGEYKFMAGNSVTLTDILVNLDYDPMKVCRCKPEYTVDTEFGLGYGINLTHSYVRCDKGQADLTLEQIKKIAEIISWAETSDEALTLIKD